MKHVEVAAAIITDGEKYFVTQRGYGAFKGWWEFPGGKIEANESHEEALKREIREELNTEIEIESFFQTVDYDYPDFHLTLHCYLCHVVSGHLELLEAEDARWLEASQLDSVEWLPADWDIIEQLKHRDA